MKFLHTADWQIGRTYSQFEADSAALSQARIAGVARIARLAAEHEVDAVLVAGDVFDTQTPRDKTILRMFQAMAGYGGPWLLLPGNHDAALPECVWQVARRLEGVVPANAILCLEPTPIEVQGRGGERFWALPAPLTQRHTHTDLTDWFDAADTPPGLLRIALAHGSVAGILADDVDSPNPIAADRAQRARLDYLALGDWHGTKQVEARTWYSGTHEPERFRTNDAGNVLLVEIDAPGAMPRVSVVPTAAYRWVQLQLQVLGAADAERAVEALAAIDATTVADVLLTGTCDLVTQQRLHEALQAAELRAAAFAARHHELQLAPTEEDLQSLQADGFVGEALQELKAQLQGPQPDLARDALLQLARIQKDVHGRAAAATQGTA